jgi:hypothetical protein
MDKAMTARVMNTQMAHRMRRRAPDVSVRNIGFFGRDIDDKTDAAMTAHHAGDA